MSTNILTSLATALRPGFESRVAMTVRTEQGEWLPKTWGDLHGEVSSAACALETLGIEPQQYIGIFSPNCPEIIVTDFAAYANRAVPVSIYSTSTPGQVAYIVNDASVRILFVGGQAQYDAARKAAADCPGLKQIVV